MAMKLVKEFLEKLTPAQIEYLNTCIFEAHKTKVNEEVTNYDNLETQIETCPICGSSHFIKYGKTKYGRQKYRCKSCNLVFGATTNTFFSHSKIKFHEWLHFIAAEINKMTLEEEVVAIGKSKTTCFNMRHKLYSAVSSFQDKEKLSGQIELDPLYTKINLKGTKPQNMPRRSKPRGKHKSSTYGKNLPGLSHRKVCIFSAIDEYDRILLKIAGLGQESEAMFKPFEKYISENSTIITDSKDSIINFVKSHKLTSESIPSIAKQKRYKTVNENSLGTINQIHQEFSDMIRKKHGVSIRHLQGYLDWLVFCKNLKYTVAAKQRRINAYLQIMKQRIDLTERNICTKKIPIDLYSAYGDFGFGIFSS